MRTTALKARGRWAAAAALSCALVAGCSSGGDAGGETVGGAGDASAPFKQEPKPLAVGELDPLLLSATDLGYGYIQNPAVTPEQQGEHDNVSIQGCATLEQLSKGDSDLNFASKADVSFTYDTSTLGEELHSDRPSVLSSKLRKLFDAYLACPTYTMTSGTTPIEVKVSKSATPKLGDEQFAYATTLNLPSGPQIMKTLAVRKGNVAVILVGAPGLVDRHVDKAVSKLPAT